MRYFHLILKQSFTCILFIELINACDMEIKVIVRPIGKLPFGRRGNLVNTSWAERV